MGHYRSNLRDLEFNLFEVFGLGDKLGHGAFADIDTETARSFLRETERLATTVLADSFAESDRNPPVFDPATSSVRVPEPFKRTYAAWMDDGIYNLGMPEDLGGVSAPRRLVWDLGEFILGASTA